MHIFENLYIKTYSFATVSLKMATTGQNM